MKWNYWYIHEEDIETVSYIWSSACTRAVKCDTSSNVCLLTVLHPIMRKKKSWPQWKGDWSKIESWSNDVADNAWLTVVHKE